MYPIHQRISTNKGRVIFIDPLLPQYSYSSITLSPRSSISGDIWGCSKKNDGKEVMFCWQESLLSSELLQRELKAMTHTHTHPWQRGNLCPFTSVTILTISLWSSALRLNWGSGSKLIFDEVYWQRCKPAGDRMMEHLMERRKEWPTMTLILLLKIKYLLKIQEPRSLCLAAPTKL